MKAKETSSYPAPLAPVVQGTFVPAHLTAAGQLTVKVDHGQAWLIAAPFLIILVALTGVWTWKGVKSLDRYAAQTIAGPQPADAKMFLPYDVAADWTNYRRSVKSLDDIGVRANLSKVELTHVNLAGRDLTESLFEGGTLRDVKFDGANMTLVVFPGAPKTCEDCSFRGANLTQAMMSGTIFRHCDFTEAVLDGANLTSVKMIDCTLTGIHVGSVLLQAPGAPVARAFNTTVRFADFSATTVDKECLVALATCTRSETAKLPPLRVATK